MRILFVDAGNYCRSPAAEAIARKLAADRGVAIEFGSAGLKDKHVGQPSDPRTAAVCETAGYELGAFRCREIDEADFRNADWILAMDRENLAQLETRRPPDARAQLALFLDGDEVADPYFGGEDGFVRMLAQIETGVGALFGRLTIS